jgi:hypothetical protein
MTWTQVQETHHTQAGIFIKDGTVLSLLANQNKLGYADEIQDRNIFYRVSSATNPKSVSVLVGMAGSASPVHVFEKLGKNHWCHHGTWVVAAVADEDDGKVFHLRPSTPATP